MKRVGPALLQLLLVLTMCPFTVPARAQSIWMPRDRDHTFLLEALHPSLEGVDSEFPSGVVYLGARVRLGGIWSITAELPYAHSEAFLGEGIFLGEFSSSSTVGNPYLGVELQATPDLFMEVGTRLPLTADDEGIATLVGASADASRRLGFAPGTIFGFPAVYDAVMAQALFNLRHLTSEGLLARVRFGPALVLATEGGPDTEVFALYALQMGYEGRALRAGGAFSGWSHVTDDSGNLGARTATQLELHADFGPWTVRPGLEVKLPIGGTANLVPVVLGFSVGASF